MDHQSKTNHSANGVVFHYQMSDDEDEQTFDFNVPVVDVCILILLFQMTDIP